MAAIAKPTIATTAIIGTRPLPAAIDFFGGESNDGVVSFSEVDAAWLTHRIAVRQLHTLLPSSTIVANVILNTLPTNVP